MSIIKSKYFAVGLMSGTSLDGLDLCYCSFEKNTKGYWDFQILKAETLPYDFFWYKELSTATQKSAEVLFELNSSYGFFLADQVQKFISKHQISSVDVIASHGHTVFHQPHKSFTVQIGDGRAIKLATGISTVYDFRSQDVLLGGNGAPLVPVGDQFLFSEYDACLNLGGFSNISLIRNGKRTAFDIGPVNIVLNHFARNLNLNFDRDGDIARNSAVDFEILEKLNGLDYYQKSAPKSLGIEWVSKEILPLLNKLDAQTAIATATEHIAQIISETFLQLKIKNVLVTGGGALNSFLIEKVKQKCQTDLIIPAQEIINYKEALIFAFMGVLRLSNENNVLCSATGSSHDHCSGILV